jgi:hypothetical protein
LRLCGEAVRRDHCPRPAGGGHGLHGQIWPQQVAVPTALLVGDRVAGGEKARSEASSSLQKPITRSVSARVYQLRSKSTMSPRPGRCADQRWKYHWLRSRSVGTPSATTRIMREGPAAQIRQAIPSGPLNVLAGLVLCRMSVDAIMGSMSSTTTTAARTCVPFPITGRAWALNGSSEV